MIPDQVLKAHRIAAFLAASTPEDTPFFTDFCEMFSNTEFYQALTPAQSMEAQEDLKQRIEFLNDMKVSQNFVMANVLQEILINLTTLNQKLLPKDG